MRLLKSLVFAATTVSLLGACSNAPIAPPSSAHIRAESVPDTTDTTAIPKPVQSNVSLAKPKPAAKVETYSVVVSNVKAQDLLFALARDAKLNVDIHPGINGTVSLNAIDQTLQQLLTRIAKQVDMRWELDGPNLIVTPDTPYLKNYKVDYVNMSRDTAGNIAVTTQIASTGSGSTGSAGGSSSGGNTSLTKIENKANNHFWETLEKNLKDILRETDKILPEGSSETVIERSDQQSTSGTGAQGGKGGGQSNLAGSPNAASIQTDGSTVVKRTTFREAASVIVNAESGVITVRATSRQHEKVQEFIDQVMASANRQVLIEATIAEVTLSNNYQQGIDWSRIDLTGSGFTIRQQPSGTISGVTANLLELGYQRGDAARTFSSTIRLLDSFGTVKVLSSPKMSVLNNQTAVLKVVDNQVYFTVKADTNSNANTSTTTFTTDLHTVPVGFVMNVTPQISESNTVLLNIRPSISRIVSYVNDPNPSLKTVGVTSQIPVIRTREMESMIRIDDGNIAVMGGLMEDTLQNTNDTVPGLARIPFMGNLFQNRNDTRSKTELVVFLRPVILKDASIDGDFKALRDRLPANDFFANNPGPQQQIGGGGKTP